MPKLTIADYQRISKKKGVRYRTLSSFSDGPNRKIKLVTLDLLTLRYGKIYRNTGSEKSTKREE